MNICVIISDVTSEGMLPALLLVLCNQDYRAGYQVWVPDSGRFLADELAILSALAAQYPVLKLERHQGRNRAALINDIAAGSDAELLVFVESHCLVPRDMLTRLAEVFRDGETRAALCRRVDLPSSEPVRHFETALAARLADSFDTGYYFDFHGAALRRDCFQRMGGLDERLPYFAEFELGARLHSQGVAIRALDDLPVLHQNGRDLSTYRRVVQLQAQERTIVYLTHPDSFNRRYFVTPGFIRLLPLLRGLRLPATLLLNILNVLATAGFQLASRSGANGAAFFLFRATVRSSAILGRIAGLGYQGNA